MPPHLIRDISPELAEGLGIAINESRLLGFEFDEQHLLAGATFEVLTLPPVGDPPTDSRVLIVFHDVGQLAASLRLTGDWTADVAATPVAAADLPSAVQSFEGQPIYGWDFFNSSDAEKLLTKSLSLNKNYDEGSHSHSIWLFQEAYDRVLEFACWFGSFEILSPERRPVAVEEFLAGGRRWWEAMRNGDPRTLNSGFVPLKGNY